MKGLSPAAMNQPTYPRGPSAGHWLGAIVLFPLLWLALVGNAAEPIKNSACLECHGDQSLTKTNAAGKEISLFVDVAKLAASVHKTNTCANCHADITARHPDDNLPAQPINCAKCHERQSETYAASVHGLAMLAQDSPAGVGARLANE